MFSKSKLKEIYLIFFNLFQSIWNLLGVTYADSIDFILFSKSEGNRRSQPGSHLKDISALFSSQFPALEYQNVFHFATCNDMHTLSFQEGERQLPLPSHC